MINKFFFASLLIFFFCWGLLTERNKIFPYKTLDFFKKNSFDKFFDYNNNNSDREIIFK